MVEYNVNINIFFTIFQIYSKFNFKNPQLLYKHKNTRFKNLLLYRYFIKFSFIGVHLFQNIPDLLRKSFFILLLLTSFLPFHLLLLNYQKRSYTIVGKIRSANFWSNDIWGIKFRYVRSLYKYSTETDVDDKWKRHWPRTMYQAGVKLTFVRSLAL